ncbi:hypothetical protein [Streptomyces sp. ME19-01-6]|uniref:hypothetical protein n=1 Tax=Streptomyces sp. ME19-01-6 TaxID=3028686 RepID=UPI0029AF38F2|nr:hypothetical protein [Streptomyces sp. ME19-01-6]MDX3224591.1 hypothetical protein [Streptomyces sp. ME19-01-6]
MNDPVGTEIEATARWLEQHTASGAAAVLRRVARQRDEVRWELAVALTGKRRLLLAWRSARERAEERAGEVAQLKRKLRARHGQPDAQSGLVTLRGHDVLRDYALMRVDLARFQNLLERAGWLPDAKPRHLWRWRDGWWELAYRKKNPKDGCPDSGWYLWGPAESYFGEWVAALKADATVEADRLIAKHLAAAAEAKR